MNHCHQQHHPCLGYFKQDNDTFKSYMKVGKTIITKIQSAT